MPDGTFQAALRQQELTGVAAGTRILTETGECRVERLRPGDRLIGAQEESAVLLSVERLTLRATGEAAPLRIFHGAFGNRRDLVVAPGQLVAIRSALVAAGTLTDHLLVERAYGGMVTYYRLTVDRDVTVRAEGALLGFTAQASMARLTRAADPRMTMEIRRA